MSELLLEYFWREKNNEKIYLAQGMAPRFLEALPFLLAPELRFLNFSFSRT